VIDFHKRFGSKDEDHERDYRISRWYSFAWGAFCVTVAMFVYNMGNSLIEAVNILGSLFYGTILGIFLVAFYMKKIQGSAVFIAACITELIVVALFILSDSGRIGLGFLWLNLVGAAGVMMIAWLIQAIWPRLNIKKE
jgi:hypothetical protein